MAWNGSGTFVRTNGVHTGATVWQQDWADSDLVDDLRMDVHDQDIADGINNCLAKDGQNAMTANLDMGNFKIINYSANGSTLATTGKGTASPTISGGSFTYTQQYAEYSRNGNIITFVIAIQGFYAATPVGVIAITHNIPFTPKNLNADYPCTVHHANVSTDEFINAGVTQVGTINLSEVTANGVQTSVDGADVNGLIIEVTVSGSFIKN